MEKIWMEKIEEKDNIELIIGDLNWNESRNENETFDLDVSAFLLNKDKKLDRDENFIFYNNKISEDDSVIYTSDNITGNKVDDEELIVVNLNKVPSEIERISIVASIHEVDDEDYYFKDIKNSNLKISKSGDEFDLSGKMMFKFDLEKEFGNEKAIIALEIVRNGEGWECIPKSKGFKGGLIDIIRYYGGNI